MAVSAQLQAMWASIIFGMMVFLGGFVYVLYSLKHTPHNDAEYTHQELQEQVNRQRADLDNQDRRLREQEARIKEQDVLIKFLTRQAEDHTLRLSEQDRELTRLRAHTLALEQERERLQATNHALSKSILSGPNAKTSSESERKPEAFLPDLLVIFGPNQTIAARDKSGLNQAGVDYEGINQATRATISEELVARREDQRPLHWLHIASDADDKGIVLLKENGELDIVEPEWWRTNLPELDILFLATCKGTNVATHIAALAAWLIYFRSGVENNDASAFGGVFWGEITKGATVETAYAEARRRVPAVKDFVSLRHRKRGLGNPGA